MIVVATNNGTGYLPALLDTFDLYGTGGRNVLVVDTGSTDPNFCQYLESLPSQSFAYKIETTRTPYRGYDSGAYVHAIRNFQSDDYFFLQDSLLVKHKGWHEPFIQRASHGVGCVPWMSFPMQWDSQEQIDWVRKTFRSNQWPPFGIFGPIFYARREALMDLENVGYLDCIPGNKLEQQAMERGWATAFTLCGWAVRPVEVSFDEASLRADRYPNFTKQFAVRA